MLFVAACHPMAGGLLKIAHGYIADIPCLTLEGDLDRATCGALSAALREVHHPGSGLVLDLRLCDYIDSGGLSVLFEAYGSTEDGGWIGAVGVRPSIRRLLEIVGLLNQDRFLVFDTEEEARSYLATLN